MHMDDRTSHLCDVFEMLVSRLTNIEDSLSHMAQINRKQDTIIRALQCKESDAPRGTLITSHLWHPAETPMYFFKCYKPEHLLYPQDNLLVIDNICSWCLFRLWSDHLVRYQPNAPELVPDDELIGITTSRTITDDIKNMLQTLRTVILGPKKYDKLMERVRSLYVAKGGDHCAISCDEVNLYDILGDLKDTKYPHHFLPNQLEWMYIKHHLPYIKAAGDCGSVLIDMAAYLAHRDKCRGGVPKSCQELFTLHDIFHIIHDFRTKLPKDDPRLCNKVCVFSYPRVFQTLLTGLLTEEGSLIKTGWAYLSVSNNRKLAIKELEDESKRQHGEIPVGFLTASRFQRFVTAQELGLPNHMAPGFNVI